MFKARHVSFTIKEFQKIKAKIESLRKDQLKTGKENLDTLLQGLRQKEERLVMSYSKNPDFKIENRFEIQKTQVLNHTNGTSTTKTVYRSVEETTKIELYYNLQKSIRQEQNLLQIWAYEQFNVRKFSIFFPH